MRDRYLFTLRELKNKSYRFINLTGGLLENGVQWEEEPIQRSAIRETTTRQNDPVVSIEMSINDMVKEVFRYDILPEVIIYRYDGLVRYQGKCNAPPEITNSGPAEIAKFEFVTEFQSAFAGYFQNDSYGPKCDKVLYGTACGAPRSRFQLGTTITAVNNSTPSITVAHNRGVAALGNATVPNNYFQLGSVLHVPTGFYRRIRFHSGRHLRLHRPFPDAEVGDGVFVYAGCNLSKDHCGPKFNNYDNFGGEEELDRDPSPQLEPRADRPC